MTKELGVKDDTYCTIMTPGEALYTEKRSRFLAFALHVESEAEAKEILAVYRKKYYDARHVCYAYIIGTKKELERANDDGEPSGSAGKPMLGQLHSAGITNALVIVVRYFGGVKLGTGGLFSAYKQASAEALENATFEERIITSRFTISAPYSDADTAMRFIREGGGEIIGREYTATENLLTIEVRTSKEKTLRERLSEILTLRFEKGH